MLLFLDHLRLPAAVHLQSAKTFSAKQLHVERCLREGIVSTGLEYTKVTESHFKDIRGPGLRASSCECRGIREFEGLWGGVGLRELHRPDAGAARQGL